MRFIKRKDKNSAAKLLEVVQFAVQFAMRPLHSKVQSTCSRTLRVLGAGRFIFGNEAIGRLKVYRQQRLRPLDGALKNDYLLSFPHSGNHWVRFILEFFSGMPTAPVAGNHHDVPIHKNLFRAFVSPLWHVQNKGYLTQKTHSHPLTANAWSLDCTSVLLLIRHYYEAQHRHLSFRLEGVREGRKEENIRWYLRILLEYEQAKVPKMHVYYEDLINDPRETIASILAFHGIDNPTLFEYFMRNYKKMQRLSRSATGRAWRSSQSGDDLFYHRKRHPEKLPELDKLYSSIYSESRYDRIRYLVDHYYGRSPLFIPPDEGG